MMKHCFPRGIVLYEALLHAFYDSAIIKAWIEEDFEVYHLIVASL